MKKILFLLCSFVTSLLCSTFVCGVTANAETEDYVADNYIIEISKTESILPVPKIPGNWTYRITLKDGETVLGEGLSKYGFTQTGNYTLVYVIHKNGSLTESLTETATLQVADVTKPIIIIPDGYEEEYFVGDELAIQTAQVEDDVDANLTASVELYFGEKKVSIENGKYIFKKAGSYKLVYTAVDSYGNESVLVYEFIVSKSQNLFNGCSGNFSAVGASALLTMAGAILILKKQIEQIKN